MKLRDKFGFCDSLVLAVFLLLVNATSWAQSYHVNRLGSLGESPTFETSINSRGDVVGVSSTSGSRQSHAFLWTQAAGIQDLGTINGSSSSGAINESGQVVGWFGQPGSERAFLWTQADGMSDLGFAGIPLGINDIGQVVGFYNDAQPHAFFWTQADGFQDLGTLGGCCSHAVSVNHNSQVAGWSNTASGDEHPFLWTPAAGMQDLGVVGEASGINNVGQVVGFFLSGTSDHAFLWSENDGLLDLGAGDALAINDGGQVVLAADHLFLWSVAGRQDLNELTSGQVLQFRSTGSVVINNAGQIATNAELLTGRQAAVRFTPNISVSLSSSPNPSYVGQAVALTATVTSVQGSPPDGENVEFYNVHTHSLLATVPLVGGVAHVSTSDPKAGTSSIKATYLGDVNYLPSAPGVVAQVVNKWPTSATVGSSQNPANHGQAVTFAVTTSSSGPAPAGVVRFQDGATAIGTRTVIGGVAALTTSKLASGSHSITAMYSGSAASEKSTSLALTQIVN
jgi:probable HAF family extracellular repeat protein